MEENDLPNLICLSVFEFVLIMASSIIAICIYYWNYFGTLWWSQVYQEKKEEECPEE